MPTPSEKKALIFLAAVALLGASVRALRAVGALQRPQPQDTVALARQLEAVDSARRAARRRAGAGATGRGTGTPERRSRRRHRLPPDTMPGSRDVDKGTGASAASSVARTVVDVD